MLLQIFALPFRRMACGASDASGKFQQFPLGCGGGASNAAFPHPSLSSILDHGNAPDSNPDPAGAAIRDVGEDRIRSPLRY